jgi:histidine triad (HIT) family protein
MDCIFCKIIKGEAPSNKIYEDEEFLAFLDIHPVNPGHTLLIPKKHFQSLSETSEEVLQRTLPLARRLANALVAVTGAQGFNLSVNNGSAAGQVVFHTHIHIIPRLLSDNFQPWHGRPYTEGEAQKITEAIRKNLL